VSQVDLAIAKTNSQTAYVPGTPISYTITVERRAEHGVPASRSPILFRQPSPA
jgi:hypothetical protein